MTLSTCFLFILLEKEVDRTIDAKDHEVPFQNIYGSVLENRLSTLRCKPFQYNTKSRYDTGFYKQTEDVTVHNNHFGTIIDFYITSIAHRIKNPLRRTSEHIAIIYLQTIV